MGYSMDLKQISLQKYMEILKNQNLLPSRRILLDGLEAKFQRIAGADITNLLELKTSLSSSMRLSAFAAKTNIPEDYLVILKRELGSLEQNPVPISDFPGISKQAVLKLSEHKLKTSKDLYSVFLAEGDMEAISERTGVSRA